MFSTKLLGRRRPSSLIAFTCALLLAPLALLGTGPAAASGGGGGGFSGSSGGVRPLPPPRAVDREYEIGKAIYLGRSPGAKKVKYCVNVDGEPKKLRGRVLRDYKGRNKLDFANALVNCQQPDELALAGVERSQIAYVIYYLNERYKLNLSDA